MTARINWIDRYLEEDLGAGWATHAPGSGDITSAAVVAPEVAGEARVVARGRCFLAGLGHAGAVFDRVGATATAPTGVQDGVWVEQDTVLLVVRGPARAILMGERTALNLLARMCGVATQTRLLVERLGAVCSGAVVAATRKTTPGFRVFEKEAVRVAGGDPYRQGLWDVAMVKDNHREAAGGMAPAVARVRAAHPDLVLVAEAETLEDVLEAAAAGADWVLIDNQDPQTGEAWAQALWEKHPHVKVEASGGIRPEDVVHYGWADRISLGWLTQGVPVPDLGLDWGSGDAERTHA